MKVRMLALVNVALIPYVAIRFPRELRGYMHGTFKCIVTGRSTLDWARSAAPSSVSQETVPG